MEFITLRGIILKEVQYNEADKILTVFSDKMGIIKVNAKGAKSLKRTDMAGLNRFCLGEYILTENKNMYNVRECNIVTEFFDIRKDIKSLYLGCYILECVYMCACENQPDEELFRLILNTLYAISKNKNSHTLIKSAFEMKLCQVMGSAFEISECPACGEPFTFNSDVLFDFEESCFICEECGAFSDSAIKVQNAVFLSLKHILNSDLKTFLSFRINEEFEKELSNLCEKYLLSNLEKIPNTLNYLKEAGI